MEKDILDYFKPYLPTLQKYLLCSIENQSKFIQTIADFHQKQLIKLLVNPYQSTNDDTMKKLNIPKSVQNKLTQSKMLRVLRQNSFNSLCNQQRKNFVSKLRQIYTDQSEFICMRPDFGDSSSLNNKKQKNNNFQLESQYALETDFKILLKNKLKENVKNIQTFDQYALLNLQKQDLMNLNSDHLLFLFNMKNIIHKFECQLLLNLVKKYQRQNLRKDNKFNLKECKFFNNFTVQQLNYLVKYLFDLMHDANFVDLWFHSKYFQELRNLKKQENLSSNMSSVIQKQRILFNIKIIQKMLNQLQPNKNPFLKPYIKKLQTQKLWYNCNIQDVQFQKLKIYLDSIDSSFYFFEQTFSKRIKENIKKNENVSYSEVMQFQVQLHSDKVKPRQLIQKYVNLLINCAKNVNETMQKLKQYFNCQYLNQVLSLSRLKKGQQISNLYDIFNKSDVDALKDTKKLLITNKNKKIWSTNQDVILNLQIKKISQIQIKIYQINAEKQLLTENKEINQSINLLDIQPSIKYFHKINLINDFHQLEENIQIKLQKKHGIFIVDLIADQINSRAVIRRGAILAFTRQCKLGYQVYFYDHNGQIIQVKIWMEGKQFKSQQGKFLIPFPKERKTFNLVCVLDDFAQIITVNAYPENYAFNFECIYNYESFIVGNNAKIIIHSSLILSQTKTPVSLSMLKDVCVTVNMKNHLSIPSTMKYQNLKFSDAEDYILQIPIQTFMSSIEIQISGQIKCFEQSQTKKKVSNKKIIYIALDKINNIHDLYFNEELSKDTNQPVHVISLLGLNGQAVSKANISVAFDFIGLKNNCDKLKKQFKTNAQGKVYLKNLNFLCRSITVKYISSESSCIQKSWLITVNNSLISSLQNNIVRNQGQTIEIPYSIEANLKNISLVETNGQVFISNKDEFLQFRPFQKKLIIKGNLHIGQYQLIYHNSYSIKHKTIFISIIQAKQWTCYGNKKVLFDEKNKNIYQISQNPSKMIELGQILINHQKQKKVYSVSIPILNLSKQVEKYMRCHVFLTHFTHQNSSQLQKFQIPESINTNKFNIKKSSYLNNKILSDETAYILNRKKINKQIGNNLQKPNIFLKNTEVRATTQIKQSLKAQQQFQANSDSDDSSDSNNLVVDQDIKKKKKNKKKKEAHFNRSRSGEKDSQNKFKPYYSNTTSQLKKNRFSSHLNFLQKPTQLFSNIKQNKISFQIQQNTTYTHLTIYLMMPTKVVKKQFDLNIFNQNKVSKQLKHLGLCDEEENKSWGLTRKVYKLHQKEKLMLNRDCQWKAVTLDGIIQFAKNKEIKFQQWQVNLLKWKTFSFQQKLQFYNKNVCHQINVYIYFKDRQFFTKIIEPFIKFKIKKTFIDCFLLNSKQIFNFIDIEGFKCLNQFEKVLLVYRLVQLGKNQQAKDIYEAMKTITDHQGFTIEQFNKYFQWIVSKKQQPKPAPVSQSHVARDARYCDTRSDQRQRGFSQTVYYGLAPSRNLSSNKQKLQQMKKKRQQRVKQCIIESDQLNSIKKPKLVKQFVEVQKTKQYTQITYFGIKYPRVQILRLATPNIFWTQLAQHFLNQQKKNQPFLSDKFIYLQKSVHFILASCFLPDQPTSKYNLKTIKDSIQIEASCDLLIFVKQTKLLPQNDSFGLLMNQRFIDPKNKTKKLSNQLSIEKEVEQFILAKPYTLQTIISNTSSANLPLQFLFDIPKGSIPLDGYQYILVKSDLISPYSTKKYQRQFYFPCQDDFSIYPSNAAYNNQIISKARISKTQKNLKIMKQKTIKTLQTFSEVLNDGTQEQIIQFLSIKNIFSTGQFIPTIILWMLQKKQLYDKIIKIFRKQKYYNQKVWAFSFLHEDIEGMKEYLKMHYNNSNSKLAKYKLPYFQYYPYNSSRCHQFLNQTKSTLRNVQFKETYQSFVIACSLENYINENDTEAILAFCYYLILQDRIFEAELLLKKISQQQKQKYKLQLDYIACFLDMYQGQPNYSIARQISKKYLEYPIESWSRMFEQIYRTLEQYDKDQIIDLKSQQTGIVEGYETICRKQKDYIYINIPKNTKIEILIYVVDLELLYTQTNLNSNLKTSLYVKPQLKIELGEGQSLQTKFFKPQNFKNNNIMVQIYQTKIKLEDKVIPKKVGYFLMSDEKIQIKTNQTQGTIQIFYDGIKKPGCYCKVYSKYSNSVKDVKFYRDGYSDIAGIFKYALSDIQKVCQFKIIVIMQNGLGASVNAKPPSLANKYK